MQIHIIKDGTEYGPHSEIELDQFIEAGMMSLSDIIRFDDGSELSIAEYKKSKKTNKLLIVPPIKKSVKSDGAEIKQFLIKKGMLIRRDNHNVGFMKCDHGGKLTIETLILTVGNSGASKRVFGVNLKYHDEDGDLNGADDIDYDEIDEILSAIDFMLDLAPKLAREHCEYTEVEYKSKEGTYFGFYQSPNEQRGFISTDPNHGKAFIDPSKLRVFGELMRKAQKYLKENGVEEGVEKEGA